MRAYLCKSLLLLPLFSTSTVFAAGGGGAVPKFINYYEWIVVEKLGLSGDWIATAGAVLSTVLVLLLGMAFRSSVKSRTQDVAPGARFSMSWLAEAIMDILYSLTKENCGKRYRDFLPFLSTLFIFILISNLTGLIPGLPPTTESISTNVGMGILAFLVYNWAGVKEHGGAYIKHFLGPVAFLAPFFILIEIISHGARPLSLGLRLMGNIFGDHLLLGVFTGLTYFVFPALLLFFGLMVAVIQSYIFTLLTGIYVSMAISHDH